MVFAHNFKLAEIDPLKDKAHGFQKYDNAALDFTPTVVCHRLHLPSVYNWPWPHNDPYINDNSSAEIILSKSLDWIWSLPEEGVFIFSKFIVNIFLSCVKNLVFGRPEEGNK